MNTTSSPDNPAPEPAAAASGPAVGCFTEVLVYAGVLQATADTLELLHDFLSHAEPAVRTHLGWYLIACHPEHNTGNPGIEVAMLLDELTEATDLLHTLAGR